MDGSRVRFAVAAGVAGAAYGIAASRLPYPVAPEDFWIGNLAAAWFLIPLVVGWLARSHAEACAAGVVAVLAGVVGFYLRGVPFDAVRLGLDPGASPSEVVTASARVVLRVAAPWLAAGIAVGPLMAAVGRRAGVARTPRAALAMLCGAVLIAEPFVRRAVDRQLPGPMAVWGGEMALGAGLMVSAVLGWNAASRGPAMDPPRGSIAD